MGTKTRNSLICTVHRVRNEYGPQTNTEEYTGTLDKLMFTSPSKIKQEMPSAVPSRIEERLWNAERFLNIKAGDLRDIYQRIKNIENRILHLETVSPEYNHFLVNILMKQKFFTFGFKSNDFFHFSKGTSPSTYRKYKRKHIRQPNWTSIFSSYVKAKHSFLVVQKENKQEKNYIFNY